MIAWYENEDFRKSRKSPHFYFLFSLQPIAIDFVTLPFSYGPLTFKIPILILLNLCHTILTILVWRIWYSINQWSCNLYCLYSPDLSAWYCTDAVRRKSVLVTPGIKRDSKVLRAFSPSPAATYSSEKVLERGKKKKRKILDTRYLSLHHKRKQSVNFRKSSEIFDFLLRKPSAGSQDFLLQSL